MATKNKKPVNVIQFSASVASIKTLVDGGIRITFDMPEDAIAQAAQLMACKKDMIPLRVEVKADPGTV
ncbi:MAG: hypothetical protein AABZ00_04985 [Chloroflexota bacterium]